MLDYNDFAGKFGAWAELMRPFVEGDKMSKIYQRLKEDSKKELILPDSDNTFKVWGGSHPDNIKTIWYLMDPYPRRYKNKVPQATGIAMDCSNSPDGKMQPSLEIFYDAIDKEYSTKVERSLSLDYLLQQGVMLTNTDLTCKLNKTASHEKLWEPFQQYFLENIMGSKGGIVYVLAGKASHRMEKFINPLGNYILKVEHPAAAAHKNTDWECQHVFTRINKLLKENGKESIMWNKADWEEANSCPF